MGVGSIDLDNLLHSNGPVDEIELDAEYIVHQDHRAIYDKHRVSSMEIVEAHGGSPLYIENEGSQRRAPLLLVGPTENGRMIAVPLEPTGRWGIWRAVTAFEANSHHRERYYGETR